MAKTIGMVVVAAFAAKAAGAAGYDHCDAAAGEITGERRCRLPSGRVKSTQSVPDRGVEEPDHRHR